jgi:cytidylate kinase
MAVITINREVGTGGRELGKLLAAKLGYQYVDKTLLQKVAEELNVSESALQGFERSREFRISNLFAKMYSKHYIQRIVGHDKSVVEEGDYQKSLRNLIEGVAKEDNVVILGRASYYFLQNLDKAYHIRLIAPVEWRKRYLVEHMGITKDSVTAYLERRDRNRMWFHRSLCGEDSYDPSMFHLVVNMARVPMNKALKLILDLVQS